MDLDPLPRELLVEMRRSNESVVAQMEKGHAQIASLLEAKNESDERRHREAMDVGARQHQRIVSGLAELDKDLEQQGKRAQGGGWVRLVARGASTVWGNDTVQKLVAGVGIYLAWHYLQVPPTPTPVQIEQPVEVRPTAGADGYGDEP